MELLGGRNGRLESRLQAEVPCEIRLKPGLPRAQFCPRSTEELWRVSEWLAATLEMSKYHRFSRVFWGLGYELDTILATNRIQNRIQIFRPIVGE